MPDLEQIVISEVQEQKIKNKSPANMPLNPTSQGWSGQEVRRQFARALLDNEASVLSEMKSKLIIIKDMFQSVFGDGEGDIQAQIDVLVSRVDNMLEGSRGIFFPEDVPAEENRYVNLVMFDTN